MRAGTLTQTADDGQPVFRAAVLEALFEEIFESRFDTRLRGGASEPFYQPARGGQPALIHYTNDYFRSALHEVAHWCVAGAARRELDDYGYWYAPDGRTADRQREFERVEVLPQAWELLFCAACRHRFRVSADNLGNAPTDLSRFENAVRAKAEELLAVKADGRGCEWTLALARAYRGAGKVHANWLEEVFLSW